MPAFTRVAIINAFLKLLDERPLSKITVKDFVDVFGVNRNTFYYFEDILTMIEAISKEEVDRLIQKHAKVDSMEDCLMIGVNFIMEKHRAVLHFVQFAQSRSFRTRIDEYLPICGRNFSLKAGWKASAAFRRTRIF